MKQRFRSKWLTREVWINPSHKAILLALVFLSLVFPTASALAQSKMTIVVSASASPVEDTAARELATNLHALYPGTDFTPGTSVAAGPSIYLGTTQNLPKRFSDTLKNKLSGSDDFAVQVFDGNVAVIAGGSPRATFYAVDALLEKLGFGFYLSYNTTPEPSKAPFSFVGWELADSPVVHERVIFDWHNFLSGCSTWNLEDWQRWITQASHLRFNTMMVHAYGNNPMFSFSLNGETKPTGYLANTQIGRDWGTEHVLDVRKIVGGEDLFNGPVFGADASLVPDKDTVTAATSLMRQAFQFARDRGMDVTFALDVDTDEANPQNVIKTLPASARFAKQGRQLVDPDTPDGYVYYRAEVEQLLKLYPQIRQLAVWVRGGLNSPWRTLRPEEFPPVWRGEYASIMEANPALKNDPEAPGLFAISKIVKAFRGGLDETGHSDVTLAFGSWRFTFLPSAQVFMPANVTFMPLDYSYEFNSDSVQEVLRRVGRQRSTVPIVWAQHDDREYAGRSYTPFAGLGSMLQWSNSAGYGVIHWTTRPLDLFFKNVANQVWTGSKDETLDVTTSEMARRTFGVEAEDLGKQYLLDWIYNAPAFGRETTDRFIDQPIDADVELRGTQTRLHLLEQMKPLATNAKAADWITYYEDWERFAEGFFQSQSALQNSIAAFRAGDLTKARKEMTAVSPERVIEQYAHTIQHGETSLGEKGILISLNLRWLPYMEAQRQILGLEPLLVEFAPTFHEPLAQGPGRNTFDFTSSMRMVDVLGSTELGVDVQRFNSSGTCPTGIELSQPQTFAIGGIAGSALPAGLYHMKMNLLSDAEIHVEADGNSRNVSATSEIEVKVHEGKAHFTLSPVTGTVRVCGLSLTAPNSQQ